MSDEIIWTFFYGSNMDLDVLKSVDYVPEHVHTAKLSGYDIRIDPLANLVKSDAHCVYGIIASGTHAELDRLYGEYVQEKLGARYLPYPVICERTDGSLLPALCYLNPKKTSGAPNPGYIDKVIGPAKSFGFPDWYLQRLGSFR